MSKFIFKAQDFGLGRDISSPKIFELCSQEAEIANRILETHLKTCPTVYGASIYDGHGDDGFTSWLEERQKFATHKAKLFDIERVEGE